MTVVVAEHSGLLSFGWIGVWLFYVISGFVVTGSLVSAPVDTSRVRSLSGFYLRRFARILPPYYFLVVIAIIVSLKVQAPLPAAAVTSYLLFFNNTALASGWGDLKGFNLGNLWTVSVEMQFYALYGVAFAFVPRRYLAVGLMTLLIVCPTVRLIWGMVLAAHATPPLAAAFYIYSSSVPQFDAFAAGCLLALYRSRLTARLAAALLTTGVGLLALYCAVYVGVNVSAGARGISAAKNIISGILYGQYREVFVYIPIVVSSASLIALIATRSRLVRGLDWRPLVFVGEISYGAYLYHIGALGLAHMLLAHAPLHGVNRFLIKGVTFGLGLSLTLAAAAASYYGFERPIVRAMGRWLRHWRALDAAATPA